MARPRRALVVASVLAVSRGFAPVAPRPRRATRTAARLDAEEAEEMRKIFEAGADITLTPEQEMELEDRFEDMGSVFDVEDMKTIFRAGVEAEGGATLSKGAGSLADLDDASFKMLMWKRLGDEDFKRIFSGPRVELEIK